MIIPINRDYYAEKDLIYTQNEVNLQPGLTVLVGCNGSGKTTLLHQIETYCRKIDIPCVMWSNYKEGSSHLRSKLVYFEDYERLSRNMFSSEGEEIHNNLEIVASKIGKNLRNATDKAVVLLDAIDSGLSVDNIVEFKKDLVGIILEDCAKRNIEVYIIVSANEYEMARGEQCIYTPELKYVNVSTYNKYRKLIIKSRKRKNKRYKWGVWDYE